MVTVTAGEAVSVEGALAAVVLVAAEAEALAAAELVVVGKRVRK
jgi:hypothetical protein